MEHIVVVFAAFASFDLALNVAAGASAATVGARLNHKQVTAKVLRLGALAGLTKSAMTTFREIAMMQRPNLAFTMLFLLLFTSWGICLVVAAEICNLVLEESRYP